MLEIGDVIIGNERARDYLITGVGVKCKIVDICSDNGQILVYPLDDSRTTYWVYARCFDKVAGEDDMIVLNGDYYDVEKNIIKTASTPLKTYNKSRYIILNRS